MNREEAISELQKEQVNSDIEVAHSNADDTLCELLISLGYQMLSTNGWKSKSGTHE